MKISKLALYTFAIAFLSSILVACQTQDEESLHDPVSIPSPRIYATSSAEQALSKSVITLTFGVQYPEITSYQVAAQKFTTANPNVQIQIVRLKTYDNDQIARMVDTALVDYNPNARSFLNLTPFIDADATIQRNRYFPGVLEAGSRNQNVYVLPRSVYLELLGYNKALWSKQGLPPSQADFTWRNLRAAASALADPTRQKAVRDGWVDFTPDIESLRLALLARNIDIVHTSITTLKLDQPGVAEALDDIATLVRTHALGIPALTTTLIDNPDAATVIRQQIDEQRAGIWPYIMTAYDPPKFDIGILPSPATYRNGIKGYVMSSGTRYPEEAWHWLSFLAQENVSSPIEEGHAYYVPARRDIAEQSGYWRRLTPDDAAMIQSILTQPIPNRAISEDNISAYHYDILVTALKAVVEGKLSATQAAAAAQAELERRIAGATPVPTISAAPFTVATPIPDVAQPSAVPIRFSASGLPADRVQALAQQFAAKHPDIAVQLQTPTSAGTLAALARNNDCFVTFQTPQAGDPLLDLQPLADADATFPRGDLPAAVLARFQQHGRVTGLPLQLGLPALHANPAVLAAAQVAPPTAATTPDQFRAAAQQATSGSGANRRYGFVTSDGVYGLNVWLAASGVLPVTQQGDALTPAFTAPALQPAVQAYLDLLRRTSPHTRLTGYTREPLPDESAAPFSAGQVAFWLDPTDRYGATGATTSTGTLLPLPQDANALPNFTVALAGYISAQSTQPEACWQWLRFLSDQAALLAGTYPARTSQATALAEPAASVYAAAVRASARTPRIAADVFDDPRIDLFWFYRAVDRALQGGNLARELADAQTTTEAYLACVAGGGAGPACATQVDPAYAGLQRAGP